MHTIFDSMQDILLVGEYAVICSPTCPQHLVIIKEQTVRLPRRRALSVLCSKGRITLKILWPMQCK